MSLDRLCSLLQSTSRHVEFDISGLHMLEPPCSRKRSHMLEPPCSRKRPRWKPPQLNELSQSISKKQNLRHSGISETPAAFWDNLSKIWLTKRALRELDRRNAQFTHSLPRSSHRETHRPVTRSFLTQVKLSARDGGPDLSDLRTVCSVNNPSG